MVKINAASVEQYIRRLPSNIRSVLLYGPDQGLVSERANILVQSILAGNPDPFSLAAFSYDQLKDDLSPLLNSLLSQSLMGGKKVIKLSDIKTSMPKSLQDAITQSRSNHVLIVIASDLSPSTSLRKFYEQTDNLAAIACYKDDEKSIGQHIRQKLRENNIIYSDNIITLMEKNLVGDRLLVNSELNKIICYLGSRKNLQTEDITKLLSDPVESSLDDLCHFVAIKNAKASQELILRLFSEEQSPIAIIRSLLRYFSKLYQAKLEVDKGISEAEAIKTLSPPLFFKQVPNYVQALKKWSSKQLLSIMQELNRIEALAKQTGTPTKQLLSVTLMNFTLIA